MLGVTKHCLFADTELSNKVELLVFSATKGRDSFIPRSSPVPVAFLPVTPQILEFSNFDMDIQLYTYTTYTTSISNTFLRARKLQALCKQLASSSKQLAASSFSKQFSNLNINLHRSLNWRTLLQMSTWQAAAWCNYKKRLINNCAPCHLPLLMP